MAKIVICDDDVPMANVIASALRPQGHTILTVNDGSKAIEMAKREEPDLMVLDIRLPDVDGLQVLAEVKKALPNLVVIMISGFGEIDQAVQTMKLGAFDFIAKPFKVDELIEKVRRGLGSKLMAKENFAQKEGSVAPDEVQVAPRKPQKSAAGKKSPVMLVSALAIGAVIVFGAGIAFIKMNAKSKTKGEYVTPYANPTALAFSGKYLWASDWFTQSIYQHNIDDNLSPAHIYYIQDSHFTGLAWDGVSLWSCNSWAKEVYRHKLDDRLSIDKVFASPGPEPSALSWDGVNLWVCDSKLAKIFKVKISDSGLSVIGTYEAPGSRPVGLYFDGKNYFSADGSTGKIYKHNPSDMRVVEILMAPQYENDENKLSGMTWDGNYLWTCTEGTQKIFRHNPKDLKKVQF